MIALAFAFLSGFSFGCATMGVCISLWPMMLPASIRDRISFCLTCSTARHFERMHRERAEKAESELHSIRRLLDEKRKTLS